MAIVEINEDDKRYYSVIISYIGLLSIYTSFALLIPIIFVIAFPNEIELIPSFVIPSILSFITGYLLWRIFRKEETPKFEIRHTTVIVTFGWILAVFFGSLPFYLSGEMTLLDGVFEAMSGWSTTGLTMVGNENYFPHLLLFWRSLMQLIGGAGLAVLMLTAVVGSTDIESGMYISEGREEKLLPSIESTTKLIVKIYISYVLIGSFLYIISGMNWFDAINHSMAAFSTGGFSTKDASLGAFSSTIKVITLFFMFFGNINFALHYEILKGNIKEMILDIEPSFFFKLLSVSFLALFGYLFFNFSDYTLPSALFHSLFQVTSALTTTGYMTQGGAVLLSWGGLPIFIIVLLMLTGASTESTGGGIKQLRVASILKSIYWETKRRFLPKRAVLDTSIRHIGKKISIKKEDMWDVTTFTSIFLLFYLFGVSLFLMYGYSLEESLFEFASAIGTVGLTVGVTGPNMPNTLKVAEIFGMWLGRLEFWTIITGFLSFYRDIRR